MVSITWFLSLLYSLASTSADTNLVSCHHLGSFSSVSLCLFMFASSVLQSGQNECQLERRCSMYCIMYIWTTANTEIMASVLFFGGGGTFIFLCFILWVLPFLCSDCCEFASEWASKTRLFQCLITIATVIIVHLAPSFVYCVLNVLLVCWWVYKSLSCLLRSQLTPGQWLHMKTNFLDNSGTYKFMFY